MAKREDSKRLESWLNKATDPSNLEDQWDCIQEFYQIVNKQTDGPQVATRLLAHKIQSPQEREALQALTILEACMNNCGKRFHMEAGKFRFLNELIKVLIPKYLGQWSSEHVKDRVTQVLYSWTLWLKDEPKIHEAYRLLKKEGVVKKDPKLPDTIVMPAQPQRTTESVFDQEGKAELLGRLLKSNRPEDLQTANRLIKNTIKEEQEKAERASKRISTLKEVESSAKQLRELLDKSSITGNLTQNKEDLKVLYERCDRLRPSLFRLTSETMNDDSSLAQILSANDELTLAVNAYKDTMGKNEWDRAGQGKTNAERMKVPASPREIRSYRLIDLSALDSPQTHRRDDTPLSLTLPPSPLSCYPPLVPSSPPGNCTDHSRVDLELIDLGFDDLLSKPRRTQEVQNDYSEELLLLSRGLQMNEDNWCIGSEHSFKDHGSESSSGSSNGTHTCESGSPLEMQNQPVKVSGSPGNFERTLSPADRLTSIYVPMEAIRPSQLEPITVYDQGGVHVSLHFARDTPPDHPDVAVMVLSAVNTSTLPVKNFLFKAAVIKTMAVKLQPSSASHLPSYNPLQPPAAISQLLLLANPQRLKVRLRYKLTLLHGDRHLSETGEIDGFADWTSMVDI